MTHSKTIAALAIALVMTAATNASADLIAATGSGQAGTDFANITPTVTVDSNNDDIGQGVPTDVTDAGNFFDADNSTFGFFGGYYWNNASWFEVTIDFGQEVQVERIEALWTAHNQNYSIPESTFRADSKTGTVIQNIPFNGTPAGYPNSTITDTGTLASPVTLSKLVLYIEGNDQLYGVDGGSWNELNITGQVPEPATMGLLGVGALALIRRKRQ